MFWGHYSIPPKAPTKKFKLNSNIDLKKGTTFKKGQILFSLRDTDAKLLLAARKSAYLSLLSQLLPDLATDYPDQYDKWNTFFNSINVDQPISPLPSFLTTREKNFAISRNILAEYDVGLKVIDYQDMCIGPVGIDLAGIFFDHYLCNELHSNKTRLIKQLDNLKYLKSGEHSFENKEIYEFSKWGCIQRNMRILGTLSNLYLEQDRSFRLKDLAGILDNLVLAIPSEFQELKNFLKKNVSKRNDQICKEFL